MNAEKDNQLNKMSAGSTTESSLHDDEKATENETEKVAGREAKADLEEYPGGLAFSLIAGSLFLCVFLMALDLV